MMSKDDERTITITIDEYKELLDKAQKYEDWKKASARGGGSIKNRMTKDELTTWAKEMVAKREAKKKLNITEQKANIK